MCQLLPVGLLIPLSVPVRVPVPVPFPTSRRYLTTDQVPFLYRTSPSFPSHTPPPPALPVAQLTRTSRSCVSLSSLSSLRNAIIDDIHLPSSTSSHSLVCPSNLITLCDSRHSLYTHVVDSCRLFPPPIHSEVPVHFDDTLRART